MDRGCILFFARRTDDGRVWCERCLQHASLVMTSDGHHVADVECRRDAGPARPGALRIVHDGDSSTVIHPTPSAGVPVPAP